MPVSGNGDRDVLTLDPDRLLLGPDGVKPWNWPHRHEEHWALSRELVMRLVNILRETDRNGPPSARNITLLSSRLLAVVTSLAYWSAVAREAGRHRISPRPGPSAPLASLVLEDRVPDRDRIIDVLASGARAGAGARFPWLRMARELIERDGYRRRPLSLVDLEREIVTVARQPLIDRAAQAEKRPINLTPLAYWFPAVPASARAAIGSRPLDREPVNRFVDALAGAFRETGLDLRPSACDFLTDMIGEGCRWIDFHLERIEARSLALPKRLWIGSSGIIWNRLLASRVRANGGHVTAFDHAQGADLTCDTLFAFNEAQSVDRFVTFSQAHAANYRAAFPAMAIANKAPEVLVAPPGDRPAGHIETTVSQANVGVRSALYVAPLVPSSEVGPYGLMTAAPSFDWQARLVSMLLEQDLTVGLKPHPESPVRHPAYFSSIPGVSMLAGRSEEHLPNHDVVIIDFPFQTTFGQALRAGRPIVFIDLGFARYTPQQRRKLECRCAVVEGRFDRTGRVQVDPGRLASAISLAPTLRDPAFLAEIDGAFGLAAA